MLRVRKDTFSLLFPTSRFSSWCGGERPGPRGVARGQGSPRQAVNRETSGSVEISTHCPSSDFSITQSYQKCFVNCKVKYKCKQLLLWLFGFIKCLFFFFFNAEVISLVESVVGEKSEEQRQRQLGHMAVVRNLFPRVPLCAALVCPPIHRTGKSEVCILLDMGLGNTPALEQMIRNVRLTFPTVRYTT